MRHPRFFFLIVFAIFSGMALSFWGGNLGHAIQRYVENEEFLVLKQKYTADDIVEAHRKELFGEKDASLDDVSLQFHPHLLMEVAYQTSSHRLGKGVLLWSLVDGEMVIDASSWEKTRGFSRALQAKADFQDFLVLNTLARFDGELSLQRLYRELRMDKGVFLSVMQRVKDKSLVMQKDAKVSLLGLNSCFPIAPRTTIGSWFMNRSYAHAKCVKVRYSEDEVQELALAAFGDRDFKIIRSSRVYIPVYNVLVRNHFDGSLDFSAWNGMTGGKETLVFD